MKYTFLAFILVGLIVAGVAFIFIVIDSDNEPLRITSFEECAQYYPVMESYPRQCRTDAGELFIEVIHE